MRSEFNEAFKEHRQEGKSYSAEYKLGALWAWDYRQSKVDELQKRVDAALKILSSKKKMYVDMFIEIEQALKGGDQNTEKQPNKHAEKIATKGVKGGDQ
jgi:hypothetical protein